MAQKSQEPHRQTHAERRAEQRAKAQARAEQQAKERKQQTIIGVIVIAVVVVLLAVAGVAVYRSLHPQASGGESSGTDLTVEQAHEQLKTLDTANIAAKSWNTFGEVILADSVEEAVAIANDIAPEHLEVILKDESHLKDFVNFGSLFIGQETGEVFGDYASGPNHTLPTVKAARYTGGVWVGNFLKVCSFQRYNRSAMQQIAPLVSRMAHGEGLTGHARAAEIRMELLKDK